MNRIYLIIALLTICVSIMLGQTIEKTKTFGSSLEKYKNGEKKGIDGNPKNNDEIIEIKTDLVVNDILVMNEKGLIVTELKKEDFIIYENSELQKIEMFSFGENTSSPRSIVLIIDTGVTQLPYLKNSIQAAKILVNKLRPNDKMAIVTDNLSLLADFTRDKVLLKKRLDSIEVKYEELTNGREFTNLLAVLNEIFETADTHRIILLQGSGNGIFNIKTDDETLQEIYKSWLKSRGVKSFAKKEIAFSDIEKAIEKSQATIYSIIPGLRVLGLSKKQQFSVAGKSLEIILRDALRPRGKPIVLQPLPYSLQSLESKRLNFVQESMFKVADLSGGYTSFLEKPEDAENIYDNIFNDFSNRYLIGYYPTNQKQDGKKKNVKIEVKNHPEYRILYRESYLPREH